MNKLGNLLASYPAAMIAMLLCAFAIAYLQYLTPWQLDDLYYGQWAKFRHGGVGIDFNTSVALIKGHYNAINGRLGDKSLFVVLSYMPKWCFATITGLATLSTFYFGSLLAFGSVRRHPLRSILMTGCFVCLLPWFCNILIASFALNYIWGAGLSAIVAFLFVRAPRPHSKWLYAGAFFASLISAWWHGAWCVPILPGMVLFLIIIRDERSAMRYVTLAGTIAGLMLLLSSPGFWLRTNTAVVPAGASLQTFRGLLIGPALSWGVLIGLLCLCFPGYRKKYDNLTIASASMAGIAIVCISTIFFCSVYAIRMFWYVDVYAYPVIAMLCVPFIGYFKIRWRHIIVLCMIAFITVHFGVAINRQMILWKNYNEVLTDYINSPDGIVYHDFDFVSPGPALALRKTGILIMLPEYRGVRQGSTYFYRNDSLPLSLVPSSLKNFNTKQFPKGKNAIRYERGFISRDTTLANFRSKHAVREFIRSDGGTMFATVLINPFITKDSVQLYYFEIDGRLINDDEIVDIKL